MSGLGALSALPRLCYSSSCPSLLAAVLLFWASLSFAFLALGLVGATEPFPLLWWTCRLYQLPMSWRRPCGDSLVGQKKARQLSSWASPFLVLAVVARSPPVIRQWAFCLLCPRTTTIRSSHRNSQMWNQFRRGITSPVEPVLSVRCADGSRQRDSHWKSALLQRKIRFGRCVASISRPASLVLTVKMARFRCRRQALHKAWTPDGMWRRSTITASEGSTTSSTESLTRVVSPMS